MIHLRPTFGRILTGEQGRIRLGNFWLREESPGMYRINDSQQDATIAEAAPDLYRLSDEPVGDAGLVKVGAFFRIAL